MSFMVSGIVDGISYEVRVTGDPADPVQGSKAVKALLAQWTGQTVLLTPVGPTYTVDPRDAKSVMALLATQTRILDVGDGAPSLLARRPLNGAG